MYLLREIRAQPHSHGVQGWLISPNGPVPAPWGTVCILWLRRCKSRVNITHIWSWRIGYPCAFPRLAPTFVLPKPHTRLGYTAIISVHCCVLCPLDFKY